MFGNINNSSRRNERNDNYGSSKDGDNKFKTRKPNIQDQITYSISSEEESEESQKSIRRQKNKSSKVDELTSIKKENIELKVKNELLIQINKLTESLLKNNSMLFDISNEQQSIKSRLEKLENEQKLKSLRSNNESRSKLNDGDIFPIGDNSFSTLKESKSPVNNDPDKHTHSVLPKMNEKS